MAKCLQILSLYLDARHTLADRSGLSHAAGLIQIKQGVPEKDVKETSDVNPDSEYSLQKGFSATLGPNDLSRLIAEELTGFR